MTTPFEPKISPTVAAGFPGFHLTSIVARNLALAPDRSACLEHLINTAEASLDQSDDLRERHLEAWSEAYQAFGAKPKRTPCSAQALFKRSRKEAALPRISPLVDAYNAVSVLHGIPVGGEDLDRYRGLPRLEFAAGNEPFQTVKDGQTVTEYPDRGEVIWRDDFGVTCRRWNWRQGPRTMVTERSRNVWFVLEALPPMPAGRLQAAGQQLVDAIRSLSPEATIDSSYMDASAFARPGT